MFDVRRREFITFIGGAALAWPVIADAQRSAMPVVGFLHPSSLELMAYRVAAFRKGLSEIRYEERRNVVIDYRWGGR